MPLDTVLMERFKVATRAVENPKAVTLVTATAQVVLSNNPNRFGFIIVNLGLNPVYVALTNQVSATYGIRLDASGGAFSCIWDEDFQMTGWAWWCIAPVGDSAVYSLEVVEA